MLLCDTLENIVSAGFRAIIKRAFRMRAIEAGLSPICSDLTNIREHELVEWAKKNAAIVVKTANRWLEISRMELRFELARIYRERMDIGLRDLFSNDTDAELLESAVSLRKRLFEAQEKMRWKTQQAERVFNLFR